MKSLNIIFSISLIVLLSCLNAQSQESISNQESMPSEVIVNQESSSLPAVPINEEIVAPIVNAERMPIKTEAEKIPVNESSIPVVNAEPTLREVGTNLAPVDHTFFNKMISLAGRWEGTAKNEANQPDDKIVVIYEVTAGGNAVLERLFPGTRQEMITMYYENKGKLALTHFSILGNRPVMQLKEAQENVFVFEFFPNFELNPAVDTHMNSLKIAFVDEYHMNQAWMMFEGGKPAGSYSFQLTRVPAN